MVWVKSNASWQRSRNESSRTKRALFWIRQVRWTLAVRFCLVIEVGALEVTTNAQRSLQHRNCFVCLLIFNHLKNNTPINMFSCLCDQRIAYLPHHHNQTCRRIVKSRVFPHKQKQVHDRSKNRRQFIKRLIAISFKPSTQRLQILQVIVRLCLAWNTSLHNLTEACCTCFLRRLEASNYRTFRTQLLKYGVQVCTLRVPEV